MSSQSHYPSDGHHSYLPYSRSRPPQPPPPPPPPPPPSQHSSHSSSRYDSSSRYEYGHGSGEQRSHIAPARPIHESSSSFDYSVGRSERRSYGESSRRQSESYRAEYSNRIDERSHSGASNVDECGPRFDYSRRQTVFESRSYMDERHAGASNSRADYGDSSIGEPRFFVPTLRGPMAFPRPLSPVKFPKPFVPSGFPLPDYAVPPPPDFSMPPPRFPTSVPMDVCPPEPLSIDKRIKAEPSCPFDDRTSWRRPKVEVDSTWHQRHHSGDRPAEKPKSDRHDVAYRRVKTDRSVTEPDEEMQIVKQTMVSKQPKMEVFEEDCIAAKRYPDPRPPPVEKCLVIPTEVKKQSTRKEHKHEKERKPDKDHKLEKERKPEKDHKSEKDRKAERERKSEMEPSEKPKVEKCPNEQPPTTPVRVPTYEEQMEMDSVRVTSRLLRYIDNFQFPFINDVSKYERLAKIGQGTFGEVFKARCKKTSKMVALKKVLMDNEKEGFPITALREVKMLQSLKHRNITELIEVCSTKATLPYHDRSTFYLVFAFCEHDLAGLLCNQSIKFKPIHKKTLMKHMMEGLYKIHKSKILHRDMKSANVLISRDGVLKLADFGLSRTFPQSNPPQLFTNRVVTLWYRPPELLLGERMYNGAVDMWGAGCIMAELYTRAPIMQGATEQKQLIYISNLCGPITKDVWEKVDSLPYYGKMVLPQNTKRSINTLLDRHIAKEPLALQMIEELLTLDPSKRLSATNAVEHTYFFTEPLPAENIKDLMDTIPTSQFEFTTRPPNVQGRLMAGASKVVAAPVQPPKNLAQSGQLHDVVF